MRKTLWVALLWLCACGPVMDYARSPKVPVEVSGFEEMTRKHVTSSGRTVIETSYRFFLKNTSGTTCKMLCVEYGGFYGKDYACTPPGNYPPLSNAVVFTPTTTFGLTVHKYIGYCITEIIYKK